MKALISKYAIYFIATVYLSICAYSSEDVEKKIHKEFNVEKGHTLSIINKFGNVNIVNWDKDLVSIDVVIYFEYENNNKVNKLFDYIDIELNQYGNEIKAITNFKKDFDKIRNSISTGNNEFSINYTINIPEYINLNMTNKFGSASVDKVSGNINFNIKHGDFEINNLINNTDNEHNTVLLRHGSGKIESCDKLNLDIEHSKIKVKEAVDLNIKSRHSKLSIGNVEKLICDERHGKLELNQVKFLSLSSEFVTVDIDNLIKEFIANTEHCNIDISNIPSEFETIDLSIEHSVVKMNIEKSASYKLKGKAKHGKITYPDNSKVSRIVENTEMSVFGIVGSNKDPNSKITIVSEHGNVYLSD